MCHNNVNNSNMEKEISELAIGNHSISSLRSRMVSGLDARTFGKRLRKLDGVVVNGRKLSLSVVNGRRFLSVVAI